MPLQSTSSPSILGSQQNSGAGVQNHVTQLLTQARTSDNPDLFTATGNMGKSLQDQVNYIMQALRKPLPVPQDYFTTDPNGVLVAWIGSRTFSGQAFQGIAASNLWIGVGADPTKANFKVQPDGTLIIGNSSTNITVSPTGAVTLSGVGLTLVNGTKSIVIDPSVPDIVLADSSVPTTMTLNPTTGIVTVVGTKKITWNSSIPQIAISDSAGTNTLTMDPTNGFFQSSSSGSQNFISINNGFIQCGAGGLVNNALTYLLPAQVFAQWDTGKASFSYSAGAGGSQLSIADDTGGVGFLLLLQSAGTKLLSVPALQVGGGIRITSAGIVSSTNGYTGTQTYVKTVNFAGSTVTTGNITVVAGIVTNMT